MVDPVATPSPERRPWWHPLTLARAWTRAKYEGDAQTRTIGVLLALVGILGGVVYRDGGRVDRLIAAGEKREESAEKRTTQVVLALERSTKAAEVSAAATLELAKQTEAMKTAVLQEHSAHRGPVSRPMVIQPARRAP